MQATALKIPETKSNLQEGEAFFHKALLNRTLDFWFLGGASIIAYGVLLFGQYLRSYSDPINQQFVYIPATFGALSLIVNYPHFMISYKFGYGRGMGFIKKHWFSLMAVPTILIGAILFSYFSLADNAIGILSGLKATMFYLVGWHYAKQVYGSMMVYSKYDEYPLSNNQRKLLKFHIYAMVVFSFITRAAYADKRHIVLKDIPYSLPSVPIWLKNLAMINFWISIAAVIYFIFLKNKKEKFKAPSANFLIPWIAFLVWWLPIKFVGEFYYYMVPFFHSLQYLPFAYRLEKPEAKKNDDGVYTYWLSLKLLTLIALGFLFFEAGPAYLDVGLETQTHFQLAYFLLSVPILINIHHYFIDSVVWKFSDPEVRLKLL